MLGADKIDLAKKFVEELLKLRRMISQRTENMVLLWPAKRNIDGSKTVKSP